MFVYTPRPLAACIYKQLVGGAAPEPPERGREPRSRKGASPFAIPPLKHDIEGSENLRTNPKCSVFGSVNRIIYESTAEPKKRN